AIQSCFSDPSSILHPPSSIAIRGHTDLSLNELKFSGNSQRRRKHYLLFHGTFLLNFDLSLISKLLPMPSKQPTYRHARPHSDFLINLTPPADAIKSALAKTWNAAQPFSPIPSAQISKLATEKYSTHDWNYKF